MFVNDLIKRGIDMKVLLVGEFSKLHNNLQHGLRGLGVDVTTANFGDFFKKFHSDIKLYKIPKDKKYDFLRKEYSKYIYHKFVQYDVVQFISERQMCADYGFEKHLPVALVKDAKLSVLLLAGCNYYYSISNQCLPITSCPDCLKYDKRDRYGCEHRYKPEIRKLAYAMQKNVDVIVPMAYEFYLCNKNSEFKEKIVKPIDFPIIVNEEKEYNFNEKLVVYHPLNREGAKGTVLIKKAFRILQQKYGEHVEFVIKGNMPFDEYNEFVKRTDVIVDEKNGITFGMASLMAMEMGKIVITNNYRNTIDCVEYQHVKESPAFELGTTVEEIVNNISDVIENKQRFTTLAKKGHGFVARYHDDKIIAEKFLDLYERKLYKKI
ncbi:glycosyltransferase family 1 protein [bacterium D16-59]|nr:glycosyltransferase family 1 protein [bacterium D16-59]